MVADFQELSHARGKILPTFNHQPAENSNFTYQ